MNQIQSTPPADLEAALMVSKAQIAAGQTVPLEPFMDRLRASIARMDKQPVYPQMTQITGGATQHVVVVILLYQQPWVSTSALIDCIASVGWDAPSRPTASSLISDQHH